MQFQWEESEKYQDHIPCSFAYKVFSIDNRFRKTVVLYRGKNAVYKFSKAILKGYDYCKKMIKKHFNKNLIMSAEEERFQLSNYVINYLMLEMIK